MAQVKARLIEHHMRAGTLHARTHAEIGSAKSQFFQAQPMKVVEKKGLRHRAPFRWIFNRLSHANSGKEALLERSEHQGNRRSR